MEEQCVVRFCVLHQPVHGTQNILIRRLAHRIVLVVCQDDHILPRVAKVAIEVSRHIFDVIDAPS